MSRSLLVSLLMVGWFVFCGCESYNSDFKIIQRGGQTVLERYNGHNEHVTIPEGVTEIGDHAFEDCEFIKSVELPRSMLIIGDQAFAFCSGLTSVTIPESVTRIGECAFMYCGLRESVRVPEGATEEEIRYLLSQNSCRLVIRAPRGSVAEEYAREYSIPFMPE